MSEDFLAELVAGRLRWDLLRPFPRQAAPDSDIGDKVVQDIDDFVTALLDPRSEDPLPRRFYDELRASDLLRLQVPCDQGGLGLSDFNTFRVVSAAARVSGTAGFVLGVHHGIGLPALLRALPGGRTRDLVLRRIVEGSISGWADTEPAGAANDVPATVATPIGADGYEISGDKVFVSNGTVADELIVSAATPDGVAGLFLVDTRTAGVGIQATQELMGFRGLPLAAIRFDRVRVAPERVLGPPSGGWRAAPLLEPVSALGKMYLLSGAAMAIAEACLEFQRDFAGRRSVNGRTLGDYPAVRTLVADSAADAFAMDSVIRWCLLDGSLTGRETARRAAKNITTLACWRIVDRTMSLLAAEGAETARSKALRGAPAVPLERLFRDARMLRIAGGVDFAVDLWMAEAMVEHMSQPGSAAPALPPSTLSPHNQDHHAAVEREARRLARACRRIASHRPRPSQQALVAVGRNLGELFAMAVVLARAAENDDDLDQALADLHCTGARQRLSPLNGSELNGSGLNGSDNDVHQHVASHWLRSPTPPE